MSANAKAALQLPPLCHRIVMSGREGARKLVEAICEDHGHVSQEVWDSVPQAARSVFAKALRNKDKLISSSVTT